MLEVTFLTTPSRVLDFDIENRPLSYRGDWPTADVTAIAWSFVGEKKVHCCALGEIDYVGMLSEFRAAYDEATMVSGHNIRKHDLAIVNGALIEFGLPVLDEKLTEDTLRDLVRTSGLPRDQESLCDMFGIRAPKFRMSQHKWRLANRLQDVELAKKRACGDVIQHKQLAALLKERGLLKPPKRWRP